MASEVSLQFSKLTVKVSATYPLSILGSSMSPGNADIIVGELEYEYTLTFPGLSNSTGNFEADADGTDLNSAVYAYLEKGVRDQLDTPSLIISIAQNIAVLDNDSMFYDKLVAQMDLAKNFAQEEINSIATAMNATSHSFSLTEIPEVDELDENATLFAANVRQVPATYSAGNTYQIDPTLLDS